MYLDLQVEFNVPEAESNDTAGEQLDNLVEEVTKLLKEKYEDTVRVTEQDRNEDSED